MSLLRKIKQRTERRKARVRSKLQSSFPRVSIFRSLKHIYAQVIDDSRSVTLVSCSSLEFPDLKGDKATVARAVGKTLAQRAQEKNITHGVLDRGSYLYHGRVAALAEGLREGGLNI